MNIIPRGSYAPITELKTIRNIGDITSYPPNYYYWDIRKNGVLVANNDNITLNPLFNVIVKDDNFNNVYVLVYEAAVSGLYTLSIINGLFELKANIYVTNSGAENANIKRINPGEEKNIRTNSYYSLHPYLGNYNQVSGTYDYKLSDLQPGGWALSSFIENNKRNPFVKSLSGTPINGYSLSILTESNNTLASKIKIPSDYNGEYVVEGAVIRNNPNGESSPIYITDPFVVGSYVTPPFNQYIEEFDRAEGGRFTGTFTGSEIGIEINSLSETSGDFWQLKDSTDENIITIESSTAPDPYAEWNFLRESTVSGQINLSTYSLSIPDTVPNGTYNIRLSLAHGYGYEPDYLSAVFKIKGSVQVKEKDLPIPYIISKTKTSVTFKAPAAEAFPSGVSQLFLLFKQNSSSQWQNKASVIKATPEQTLTLEGLEECSTYQVKWSLVEV